MWLGSELRQKGTAVSGLQGMIKGAGDKGSLKCCVRSLQLLLKGLGGAGVELLGLSLEREGIAFMPPDRRKGTTRKERWI